MAAVTAGRTGSDLLSFVSCERIFRWWRSALRFFRGHFLLRDWSTHRAAFAAVAAWRAAPLRRRATFRTCPGLGGNTSFPSVRRFAVVRRFPEVRRFEVVPRFAGVRFFRDEREVAARFLRFAMSPS